jgi:hypothetical protein
VLVEDRERRQPFAEGALLGGSGRGTHGRARVPLGRVGGTRQPVQDPTAADRRDVGSITIRVRRN